MSGSEEHRRAGREARLRRFERKTSLPLLALSAVFIVIVVLPYAAHLSAATRTTLDRVALVIWAVFALEFAVRLYLAPDKLSFLRRNPLDLVSVALPLLRPLRVIRAVGLLRAVGVARAETSIVRILRRGKRAFGRHRILYSTLFISLMTLGVTIVTHQAEQHAAGANLRTFGGTLWWAIQVVTTVGAANSYPVTLTGRISAVVLMVIGVGLFGLVAATLASTYIFRGDEAGSQSRAPQRTDLRALADRLERIEAELHALRGSLAAVPSSPSSAVPLDAEGPHHGASAGGAHPEASGEESKAA